MTAFANATHHALFMTDDRLGNVERIAASDMILSALIESNVFDGKFTIAAAAPVDQTQVWVDTNSAPAEPKVWNGAAWVTATFADIWPLVNYVEKAGDTMTGQLGMHDGALATPALSFSADTDTGFIRTASGSIGVVADGTLIAEFTPTGLNIAGTTTSVNATNLDISDNTVVLNNGETGAGVTSGVAGVQVDRGTDTNASVIFDETDDTWKMGLDGSETAIATGFRNRSSGAGIFINMIGNEAQLRSISAGNGLRTTENTLDVEVELAFDMMTQETTIDPAADRFAFYDDSVGDHRRCTFDNILDSKVVTLGTII